MAWVWLNTFLVATPRSLALVTAVTTLAGCASLQRPPSDELPTALRGHAVVLSSDDPEFGRAMAELAVGLPGQGGISRAVVLRMVEPVPVWRLWSGPDVRDAQGRTNRMGRWWSWVPPSGPVDRYRSDYAICLSWNELTWRAACMLRAGAVVAIGPGQSVAPETCSKSVPAECRYASKPQIGQGPSNASTTCTRLELVERYASKPQVWQLYVHHFMGEGADLDCPDAALDPPVDSEDVSRALQ